MSEPNRTGQTARALYLDLLLKSVSNLIYGPRPSDPWNDRIYGAKAMPGRDRSAPIQTMVGILRLQNLCDLAQRAIDLAVPGHFIETGVWRGGCCILMRGVLAANDVRDRKVFIADSFEGLPPPNVAEFPQDTGLTLHTASDLAVPVDEVKANFARYGLLDDQVVFVKGFFSATLPKLEAEPFALIRLDGDMYESTYVALRHLYPKLSIGGFALIDDYGVVAQCRQAVDDYRAESGIDDEIHRVDYTGVWWRKTR